ncbi:hypothetical protein [Mesorhizobium ciceri]|uniref:hypothetical protein n=1 Tax=Mesorhizobium TaxID=68287 RepID=UPI0004B3102E|nr:hypothetical protein [Mesorhizobium ciceri]
MSGTIERIAKSLYEARNGPGCYPWGNRPKAHKDEYRADARAALRTIREPGIEIRKITTFEFAEVEWPKLIDAALATPGEG